MDVRPQSITGYSCLGRSLSGNPGRTAVHELAKILRVEPGRLPFCSRRREVLAKLPFASTFAPAIEEQKTLHPS